MTDTQTDTQTEADRPAEFAALNARVWRVLDMARAYRVGPGWCMGGLHGELEDGNLGDGNLHVRIADMEGEIAVLHALRGLTENERWAVENGWNESLGGDYGLKIAAINATKDANAPVTLPPYAPPAVEDAPDA